MKLDLGNISIVLLVVVYLWLFLLSLFYYWMMRHYKKLVQGVKTGNLKNVLERVIETENSNKQDILKVVEELKRLEEEGSYHIQKVGVVRFNPFREMGGDQSFSIALLDDKNSGLVITGLHTRERTRVYIKTIRDGKSNYDLSNEERLAVKNARKKKFKN